MAKNPDRLAYRMTEPSPDTDPSVRAAGCLCWRSDGRSGLELLIIHRPRYDLSLIHI